MRTWIDPFGSSPRQRRWFALGLLLAVLGVHAGLVYSAVQSERRELQNRLFLQTRDAARLAVSRLDSSLLPLLVAESARPSRDFDAFSPRESEAQGEGLPLPSGEILIPSPLLGTELPLRQLHFTWSERDGVRSPQVMRKALRTQAAALGPGATARLERAAEIQQRLLQKVGEAQLRELFRAAPTGLPALLAMEPTDRTEPLELRVPPGFPTRLAARLAGGAEDPDAMNPNAMVAHFVRDSDGEHQLLLVRRAAAQGVDRLEGVWVDWPRLATQMLAEVADVLAGRAVRIVPADTIARPRADERLATLPAVLEVGELEWPPPLGFSETRRALAVASAILLLAVGLGALALFAAWELGERRARFASGVTHELRTPLTTFQLYSELLAEQRIRDPRRQQEALETLRAESARLVRVVENVLAQARIERGSGVLSRDPIPVAAILERSAPRWLRRAAEGGLDLSVQIDLSAEAMALGDPGAVEQILWNLVDNAAKYAHPSETPSIAVSGRRTERWVEISVRDFGPGIPADKARQLFAPFRRASRDPHVQGLGLGLSLSRELARAMGGELLLDRRDPPGACFVLRLLAA